MDENWKPLGAVLANIVRALPQRMEKRQQAQAILDRYAAEAQQHREAAE